MRKIIVAVTLMLAVATAYADAPEARFSLERGAQPHAGMPFKLLLAVGGFDKSPAPEQPKLEVSGATVTPLGGDSRVSQSIEFDGTHQHGVASVTWVFSYRIEAAKPGRLAIPETRVSQGSKHATAQSASLDLTAVPTTDDMRLELQLPSRPVFVGETIEAQLVWLFRSQPENWAFTLPMAQLDEFTVSAPPLTDRRKAIEVASATKTLELPYTSDETEINGQKWGRVTIKMFVAPRVAGHVAIPPASVTSGLAVGQRDFFGQADTQLFRANDTAHALDVKPLPETDKPPGFSGAVGTSFSISVGTSRSVVQLGEPLELAITVKAGERLDALALPKLDGPGMLPADKFSVPAEAPTGELSDDGKTKTFKVTAQITAPTGEIPALTLAYFDPLKGTYQTIHSEPIALSVAGSAIVNANDVVSSAPKKTQPTVAGDAPDLALVPVDLALSAPGGASQTPLGGALLWLLVVLLYAVPLAIFAVRTWQLRTQAQRDDAAEVRAARKQLALELDRAAKDPARQTAGPVAAAIRALARVTEREPDRELLARIETESFAPAAANAPLPGDVLARVREARRAAPRPQATGHRDGAGAARRHARGAARLRGLARRRARGVPTSDDRRRRDQAQGRVPARRDVARRRRASVTRQARAACRLGQCGARCRRCRRRHARVSPRTRDRSEQRARAAQPRMAARSCPRCAPAGRFRRRRRRAAVLPRLAALAPVARRRARVRGRRAARRAVARTAAARPRDARDPTGHRLDRDAGLRRHRRSPRRRCRRDRFGRAARGRQRRCARRARAAVTAWHRGRDRRAPRRVDQGSRRERHGGLGARRRAAERALKRLIAYERDNRLEYRHVYDDSIVEPIFESAARAWLGEVETSPALRVLTLGAAPERGESLDFAVLDAIPTSVRELHVAMMDGLRQQVSYLSQLAALPVAERLEKLAAVAATADETELLAAFSNMRSLDLSASSIDAALASVALPALRELRCPSGIAIADVRAIAAAFGPQLELLDVRGVAGAESVADELSELVAGDVWIGTFDRTRPLLSASYLPCEPMWDLGTVDLG